MAMTPSAIAAVRCSSPAVWSSCSRSASLALRRRTGSTTGGTAAPAAEGRTGMVRKLWPSGSVRAAAAAAAERLESGSGLLALRSSRRASSEGSASRRAFLANGTKARAPSGVSWKTPQRDRRASVQPAV